MSAVAPLQAAETPAAVAAFARGVERRGAVLAELQSGDSDTGDASVAAALEEFAHRAASLPLAQWPQVFWSLLIARDELRKPASADAGPWARLGSGPRAALLLRLAAGLGEAEAAQVLGVSTAAYRLALQRALPHTEAGEPDPQAWQQLREQVHQRIKSLPADRVQRLTVARERAMRGEAVAAPLPPARSPRGLLRLLWALFAVCVLALMATFVWPDAVGSPVAGGGAVIVEPLGSPARPAARYRAPAATVSHPDFGLVADAAAAPLVRDLEFYSWLAAQVTPGPDGPLGLARPGFADARAAALPAPVTDRAVETLDAPL